MIVGSLPLESSEPLRGLALVPDVGAVVVDGGRAVLAGLCGVVDGAGAVLDGAGADSAVELGALAGVGSTVSPAPSFMEALLAFLLPP